MSSIPVHNRVQFERAIERLIVGADAQNRGADLDRVVAHLEASPPGVSALASLLMIIDDDVRPQLSTEVQAYRRFLVQKGEPDVDDAIVAAMRAAYDRVRG